jgi:hypothetical protein
MKKILLCLTFLLLLVGCGEREGTVKWSDCREKIDVNNSDFEKITRKYTCEFYKTRKGNILGGTCVHIEYDNNGQCKTAYYYWKKQDNICLDKAFPKLGQDDLCYPN